MKNKLFAKYIFITTCSFIGAFVAVGLLIIKDVTEKKEKD